jgi:anti-anti-sigma factor
MEKKAHNLSDETYLRIYRMMKRGIEAPRISSTLQLPLPLVREVLARFRRESTAGKPSPQPSQTARGSAEQHAHPATDEEELYIHIRYEHRYPVMELSGAATARHTDEISQHLDTLCATKYRAIAVAMDHVTTIDPAVLETIKTYAEQCRQRHVFFALCGTSLEVERVIERTGFDQHVRVFGTRMTFEERAFRSG